MFEESLHAGNYAQSYIINRENESTSLGQKGYFYSASIP